MTLVELYSKTDCHLCDEAKSLLERVQKQIQFKLREFKLTPGDAYFEEYKEMFPVVHINKVPVFKYRVNENMLRIKLQQVAGETPTQSADPGPAFHRKEYMRFFAKGLEALGIAAVMIGLVQGMASDSMWMELYLSIIGIVVFLVGWGLERILGRKQLKGTARPGL